MERWRWPSESRCGSVGAVAESADKIEWGMKWDNTYFTLDFVDDMNIYMYNRRTAALSIDALL